LEITAAQLNFTGSAILTIVDTDSAGIVGLPLWRPLIITAANIVDAEYGTDYLQTDPAQIGGSAIQQTGGHIHALDDVGDALAAAAPLAAVKAETVLIVEDTNEIQGKLPANKFMGSSDGADDDGTLNTIAGDVVNIDGIVPAAVGDLGTVQTGDSYALVNNGTYGLSALKTLIDALNDLSAQQVWEYATRVLTANTNLAGLEVDMTKIHGTAITETTGGRIAGNLSTFWDNADAVTTKTVDDIGGTATIPPRIE